jgi:hypothetical protein
MKREIRKSVILFEVDDNRDIKLSTFVKPKLSVEWNLPVLNADRAKIKILPSVETTKSDLKIQEKVTYSVQKSKIEILVSSPKIDISRLNDKANKSVKFDLELKANKKSSSSDEKKRKTVESDSKLVIVLILKTNNS